MQAIERANEVAATLIDRLREDLTTSEQLQLLTLCVRVMETDRKTTVRHLHAQPPSEDLPDAA